MVDRDDNSVNCPFCGENQEIGVPKGSVIHEVVGTLDPEASPKKWLRRDHSCVNCPKEFSVHYADSDN